LEDWPRWTLPIFDLDPRRGSGIDFDFEANTRVLDAKRDADPPGSDLMNHSGIRFRLRKHIAHYPRRRILQVKCPSVELNIHLAFGTPLDETASGQLAGQRRPGQSRLEGAQLLDEAF
jgi:hypothetical protein